MDENKKIEKLSETGEQSAEKVVGGTRHNDVENPNEIRLVKCVDCGATIELHTSPHDDYIFCRPDGKWRCIECKIHRSKPKNIAYTKGD